MCCPGGTASLCQSKIMSCAQSLKLGQTMSTCEAALKTCLGSDCADGTAKTECDRISAGLLLSRHSQPLAPPPVPETATWLRQGPMQPTFGQSRPLARLLLP